MYFSVLNRSAYFKFVFPGSGDTIYSVKVPDPDREVVHILNGGDVGYNNES